MHANNLVVNDRTAGKTVEGVTKLFPHLNREPATTLVVKAINPVDSSALMVATQQEKVFWILDFVCEKQTHHFQRLLSTVHIVSQKEIVCLMKGKPVMSTAITHSLTHSLSHPFDFQTYLRWKATVFEQAEQIRILTVHIATDLYGSPKF